MLDTILVTHRSTLGLKLTRERGFSTVVTSNHLALVQKVANQGTHAYAANTHEIYIIKVFHTLPLLFYLAHHTLGSIGHAQLNYIFSELL